jgi:hypothetical protein
MASTSLARSASSCVGAWLIKKPPALGAAPLPLPPLLGSSCDSDEAEERGTLDTVAGVTEVVGGETLPTELGQEEEEVVVEEEEVVVVVEEEEEEEEVVEEVVVVEEGTTEEEGHRADGGGLEVERRSELRRRGEREPTPVSMSTGEEEECTRRRLRWTKRLWITKRSRSCSEAAELSLAWRRRSLTTAVWFARFTRERELATNLRMLVRKLWIRSLAPRT